MTLADIQFDVRPREVPDSGARADVACFVGFVGRRRRADGEPTELSVELKAWLNERGWCPPPDGPDGWVAGTGWPYARPADELQQLLHLPVPIQSWDEFERLFDSFPGWSAGDGPPDGTGGRPNDRYLDRFSGVAYERGEVAWSETAFDGLWPEASSGTYLGAAVRSFFEQGGRRCYVVRVGDTLPHGSSSVDAEALAHRLFGTRRPDEHHNQPSAVDPGTWYGLGHLFGLPDVAFVSMPDLSFLVGTPSPPLAPLAAPPPGEQAFAVCPQSTAPPPEEVAETLRVPMRRATREGYAAWFDLLERAEAAVLSRLKNRLQWIVALPVPHERDDREATDPQATAIERLKGELEARLGPRRLAARMQLAFPWARTAGSARLPEGLESPEGVLAGVLARNALTQGTYRTAAGADLGDVFDVAPVLASIQMRDLRELVSLLARTPSGWKLASDVAPLIDERRRPGSVQRLIGTIARHAELIGRDFVFETNGERTWAHVRRRMEGFLDVVARDGGLRNEPPGSGYAVRCDRTTMTQNDLDNGRVVVEVTFVPAFSIERIQVTFAIAGGGGVARAAV